MEGTSGMQSSISAGLTKDSRSILLSFSSVGRNRSRLAPTSRKENYTEVDGLEGLEPE